MWMLFYKDKRMSTKKIALIGILAALTMTLSFIETLLPPLPMLPPGFKMGLSNIAVMYSLFCCNPVYSFFLAIIKSLFVLFINGGYAFVLSLAGSVLSVLAMAMLIKIFKTKISYSGVSIVGALLHNAAQMLIVCAITASSAALYYSPILIVAAVICAIATAAAVKVAMPIISKL